MSPNNPSVALLCLAVLAGGCGTDGAGDPGDSPSVDAAAGDVPDGTIPDAGVELADGSVAGAVPTHPPVLFPYLQMGSYTGFAAEPGPHPSAGPHGGAVRSFFNPALAASLAAGAATHPTGSAAIKELYTGANLSGWAVMVKTGSGSDGSDWYFYEVLSVTNGDNPVANGNGAAGCAGCHSVGGDFIRTAFP